MFAKRPADPVRGDTTFRFMAAHQARTKYCRSHNNDHTLSEPKPDIWFAFPIDQNKRDEIKRDKIKYTDAELSFDVLKILEDEIQIVSCPFMTLTNYSQKNGNTENRLIDDKLVCYPFVIVEVKKNIQAESERCYCQAANGCSASLSMLEAVTKHCGPDHSPDDIQPVVAFTFVGPEAKIWLAFTKELTTTNSWKGAWSSKHHMQCIWQGRLDELVCVIELCRILDNTLFWALRKHRPWIVTQLSHSIRLSTSSEQSNAAEQHRPTTDQGVAGSLDLIQMQSQHDSLRIAQGAAEYENPTTAAPRTPSPPSVITTGSDASHRSQDSSSNTTARLGLGKSGVCGSQWTRGSKSEPRVHTLQEKPSKKMLSSEPQRKQLGQSLQSGTPSKQASLQKSSKEGPCGVSPAHPVGKKDDTSGLCDLPQQGTEKQVPSLGGLFGPRGAAAQPERPSKEPSVEGGVGASSGSLFGTRGAVPFAALPEKSWLKSSLFDNNTPPGNPVRKDGGGEVFRDSGAAQGTTSRQTPDNKAPFGRPRDGTPLQQGNKTLILETHRLFGPDYRLELQKGSWRRKPNGNIIITATRDNIGEAVELPKAFVASELRSNGATREVNVEYEWEVERIINSEHVNGKLHYWIKWVGFHEITRERRKNLTNCARALRKFHRR
ncbi:MAG: hypothetical protein Q9218_007107, partial [Villophora microphyllina]